MLTDPGEAYDRWPGHVEATLVLEHVEALGPVFQEARRVVRDGGTFYLAELHPTRQFGGTQAHFEDEATGETVVIEACAHPVSNSSVRAWRPGFPCGGWASGGRTATRGRGCFPFASGRGSMWRICSNRIPGAAERGGRSTVSGHIGAPFCRKERLLRHRAVRAMQVTRTPADVLATLSRRYREH
ncbi:SAM-dependent methyltransferase [Salinibacter ruber]|nr:SAM-dependent methyltransferase [Salinibacter ruber]MCS4144774.1 SAM-dependent methyltransferase [Salinibacter ruber]